jgi:hypothetical protein
VKKQGAFFRRVNGVIDASTRGYVHVVRRLLRWEIAMLITFAIGLWAT